MSGGTPVGSFKTEAACEAAASCKAPPCNDWKQVSFVGIGPHNQTNLTGIVETCSIEVAECDYSQPPDSIFYTCKWGSKPKPVLHQFTGNTTGQNTSTSLIRQTGAAGTPPPPPGPYVLFIAPQTSNRPGGDYKGWACYFLFSYLATQGIATFTVRIPDLHDANRDNWNRVPSDQDRPYPYNCSLLNQWGPGCDNASAFLHHRHVEDVISYAESLGYSADQSVWWGYSEGDSGGAGPPRC